MTNNRPETGAQPTETAAAEALRESEERYRAFIANSSEGIWLFELDEPIPVNLPEDEQIELFYERGYLAECNDAMAQMYGFTRAAEITGARLGDFLVRSDPANIDYLRAFIRSGYRLTDAESVEVDRDGNPKVFTNNLIGIILDGAARRAWGTQRDITEQRRAAASLRESVEREQQARRQAEEASRLKDEFLATLSHELRTPLTAIIGWTHLLRTGQMSGEDAARALEAIERNGRAQAQLIDDLLDVSRIITGRLRLDVQAVELELMIESAIDAVRPAAEAKGVYLSDVLDPKAGPVSGDANRLQQVVWNLLSNAVKFTPRGGRIQVRLERVDSHVEIVVADTGQGIRPEFLPFVFDRFRQADGATTRSQGGLGLGLAIARHLTELHGGSIDVESEGLGLGTTFRVKLPLMVIHSADAGENRHPTTTANDLSRDAGPSLEGIRVLVVDDEADTCELLAMVLERRGAEVLSATSAADAFETLRRFKPDVLLSDIGMPGEDGYSLIRKVRSLTPEEGGNIPAAALTAYAREEDRIRALLSGFQIHVPKPVNPAELAVIIATLAGRIRRGSDVSAT